MVEVNTRTSKSAVLSDVNNTTSDTFDVRSWRGLTTLLTAGRKSAMNGEAYADFRDTVLSYAQSGGSDGELRKKLQQTIQTFGMKVEGFSNAEPKKQTPRQDQPVQKVPVEVQTADSFSLHIGSARPVPSFGAPGVVPEVQKSVSEESSVFNPPVNLSGVSFTPHNLPVHSEAEISVPVPAAPEVEEEIHAGIPVPVTPVPQPAIVESRKEVKTLEEYKARIAEIKRTVNAQVGNPITLIDSHNAIGREYMGTLLGAMKAVNGGAPGTLLTAMEALEVSFGKVMDLGPIVAPPAVIKHELAPEVAQIEIPEVEVLASPAPQAPEIPVFEAEDPAPVSKEEVQEIVPEIPSPEILSQEIPIPLPPVPDAPTPIVDISHIDITPNTTPALAPEFSKHSVRGVGMAHLDVTLPGDERQLVPEGVKGEVDTPEIRAGLSQLVNEWSIFRGTGFFGGGPSGTEHPLYKMLQGVDMSTIVAGRFEGATKDTILSINDYVNGWRHEQGIAHLPNETFEQYLQRVVKRILKRRGENFVEDRGS